MKNKRNLFLRFATLLLLVLPLLSCQDREQKMLRFLNWKIQNEGARLAQAESLYSLIYSHYQEGKFLSSDDFYVRRDVIYVTYGYDVNNVGLKLDGDMLSVTLPQPKKISMDKRIKEIEVSDEDFTPMNGEGEPIDIDAVMNKELADIMARNNDKAVEVTKELSRIYYRTLASQLKLKANVVFEGDNPPGGGDSESSATPSAPAATPAPGQ